MKYTDFKNLNKTQRMWTDHLSMDLWIMFAGYLEIEKLEDFVMDYKPFEVDEVEIEELWVLPIDGSWVESLRFGEVDSPTFTWGWISFGGMNGRKVVTEQCASPFGIYYKKEGVN